MVDWKIGPTFSEELRAASLTLDGYWWDWKTGEIGFVAGSSEALVDAVNAVYANHDPAAQTDPPTPYPPHIPFAPPPAT
jgi:hypothetical protein